MCTSSYTFLFLAKTLFIVYTENRVGDRKRGAEMAMSFPCIFVQI